MIDKTIGVIPPRNEQNSFSDKKTENSKDSQSEFESYFKQLTKDASGQTLGGTKKKVQPEKQLTAKSDKTKKHDEEKENEGVDKKRKKKLVNPEMVLNSMASKESVNKTPDSEENLDSLEETNLIKSTNKNLKNEFIDQLSEKLDDKTGIDFSKLEKSVQQSSSFENDIEPIDSQFESKTITDDSLKNTSENSHQINFDQDLLTSKDSKVFETLNREKQFQKLEAMSQSDDSNLSTSATQAADAVTLNEKLNQGFSQSNSQSDSPSEENFHQGSKAQVDPQSGLTASAGQTHASKDFTKALDTVSESDSLSRTKNTEDNNLKEILNQAQYLVTKGGGEVTVKMTPEGMGEVQLKVMLENGKMSVEMNTHDKSIQNLIQDSLSDLKSSLAAQHISVEHVTLNNKINTVQDAEKTNQSQNFTDANASGFNGSSKQSHQQDRRQQAGQVFDFENSKAMNAIPLAMNEIKKASANRVYQNNKANSLNAVA